MSVRIVDAVVAGVQVVITVFFAASDVLGEKRLFIDRSRGGTFVVVGRVEGWGR